MAAARFRPVCRPVFRAGPVVVAVMLAAAVACNGGFFVPRATAQPADAPKVPKPKLIPGIDPGGLALAVIGDGIDYARPEIAARLARDGEGELVGFDLVDRDRRPYAPTPPDACPDDALLDLDGPTPALRKAAPGASAGAPPPAVSGLPPPAAVPASGATGVAARCQPRPPALALAAGRGISRHLRIAVFRVAPGEPKQVAEALGMAARSPARIALLQYPAPPELLREAAEKVPRLLIVAPAPAQGAHPREVCDLANVVALGCHAGDKDWNGEGLALLAAYMAQRTTPWSAAAIRGWFAGARALPSR